ncbi:MAG: hypothetical protein V1870_04165 [Candidatus Aenigmatarchaeota archaeon]
MIIMKKYLYVALPVILGTGLLLFNYCLGPDKEAIAKRATPRHDRYYSLSDEKKKVVGSLIENRDNPDALGNICKHVMKDIGFTDAKIKKYTEFGMCTAFAEIMAQYFGNKIQSYSGDAWNVYRRNLEYRLFQIYPESIDRYSIHQLNHGKGPEIPEMSADDPDLVNGDILTMPLPGGNRYAYHSGVCVKVKKNILEEYKEWCLESRGTIRMNGIENGNITMKFGNSGKNTLIIPIAEVVGDR